MANLSGANPNLTNADASMRVSDAVDDLLRVGTFAAISSSTNGTGIAFKAEKARSYRGVVAYSQVDVDDDSNNWVVSVRAADNASYTNEVTLASVRLQSGSGTVTDYLALDGPAAASLMEAAGEDEALYVRAVATKTGTVAALTAKVYLTCD